MNVKGFNCFVFLLVMMALCDASRFSLSLKVRKHLDQLNKTPLKSIQSKDGDIIDCVHISHQPAFDHPLMKDHTIQMRPNYHPEGLFGDSKLSSKDNDKDDKKLITQLWQLNGRCPEGTIPIKRTKEEDLMRAGSIKSFGKKKSIPQRRLYDRELNTKDPHEATIFLEQITL